MSFTYMTCNLIRIFQDQYGLPAVACLACQIEKAHKSKHDITTIPFPLYMYMSQKCYPTFCHILPLYSGGPMHSLGIDEGGGSRSLTSNN